MAEYDLTNRLTYRLCRFPTPLRFCWVGVDWSRVNKLAQVVVLAFAPTIAFAAGAVYAKVTHVRVDRNGWGIIEFASPIGGTPAACRSAPYLSHFSFDSSTAGGKALYAMALAASASGKVLLAYGTGACSEYAGIVESMSYGVTYDQ